MGVTRLASLAAASWPPRRYGGGRDGRPLRENPKASRPCPWLPQLQEGPWIQGLLLWTAHSGGIQGCPGKGVRDNLPKGWEDHLGEHEAGAQRLHQWEARLC